MKKLFVLLLALTMVVGAVSAQATVNGYVRSMATYDAEAETFTLANRLRLTLGWTSEDGNVNFGARLQAADWTGADANVPVADYAYGKIKLADGKVVVQGGKLWDFSYDISSTGSDYAATGNVANGGGYGVFAANNGMLLQVLPVEGLNVGIFLFPDEADDFTQFGLGAKYTIADIGDVVFSMKGAAEAADSDLSGSFAFTGVEGLFAAVGYKGLTAHGIYALVNYTMDALFLEVAPEYNVTNETFYIEAMAKYTAGDFAIAGLFGYDSKPAAAVAGKAKANLGGPTTGVGNEIWVGGELYYTVGKGQMVLVAKYGDASGFAVSPVVRVNF